MRKSRYEYQLKYTRSKKGLLTEFYGHHVYRAKRRQSPPLNYTKKELGEWLFSQENFDELYLRWIESNYDTNFRPSIDRLKDDKEYSLDNIRLIIWKENNDRFRYDKKNGINKSTSKYVISTNRTTGEKETYHSIMQAHRDTKVSFQNISKCCKGQRNYAGNYTWEFK